MYIYEYFSEILYFPYPWPQILEICYSGIVIVILDKVCVILCIQYLKPLSQIIQIYRRKFYNEVNR